MSITEDEIKSLTDMLEGNVEEVDEKEEVETSEENEGETSEERTEESSEEAPAEEQPEDEAVEESQNEIAELKAQIEELKSAIANPPSEKKEEVKLELSEQDFIGEVDFETVTTDPQEFNKLLNKIYQKAVRDASKLTTEGVLKSIPTVVSENIKVTQQLTALHNAFYDQNKDLVPFKKVVALTYEEIASSNPKKSPAEIIKLVAPEVRKKLNLKAVAASTTKKLTPVPKLPSKAAKAGSVNTKPQTKGLESEISSMMEAIGG